MSETQTDNGSLFPRQRINTYILLQKRDDYMFKEGFKLFNVLKLSSVFKKYVSQFDSMSSLMLV